MYQIWLRIKNYRSFVCYLRWCRWKKIDIRHDSSEKSSTTKINQHAVCVYLLFTNSSFVSNRYENDYYWGKYSIKNVSKDLKQHTTKIMKCEKLKMISLTDEINKWTI